MLKVEGALKYFFKLLKNFSYWLLFPFASTTILSDSCTILKI